MLTSPFHDSTTLYQLGNILYNIVLYSLEDDPWYRLLQGGGSTPRFGVWGTAVVPPQCQ